MPKKAEVVISGAFSFPFFALEESGKSERNLHYIYSPYGLAAVLIKQGTNENLYYTFTDHLGSVISLLNPDGTLAERYSYDAWGKRRNPLTWTYDSIPAPTLIDRGFTGHEHLDEFGLINMNGRMYDPALGRFLSVDPFIQFPESAQSYNGYGYCMNNPLKYTDPSGMLAKVRDESDAAFDAYFSWLTNRDMITIGGGSGGWGGVIGADQNYVSTVIYQSNLKFYGYTGYGESGAYISKYDGHVASFDEYYAIKIAPDLAKFAQVYADKKVAEIQSAIKAVNLAMKDAYSQTLTAGPGGQLLLEILAKIIPDRISISLEGKVAVVLGIGQNIEINWMTKGSDASFLPYITNTLSRRYGGEGDAGISFNAAWYYGPSRNATRASTYGTTLDIDGGFFYGGTIFIGLNDNGDVVWVGFGSGFGGTLGISGGVGDTRPGLKGHPDF